MQTLKSFLALFWALSFANEYVLKTKRLKRKKTF